MTEVEFNSGLRELMEEALKRRETLRRLQDDFVSRCSSEEQKLLAQAIMSGLFERCGVINVTVHNDFSGATIGAAVTGGTVHGGVTGNAQSNQSATASDLGTVLAELRRAIAASSELSATQKEDQVLAVADIEAEAAKPEDKRNTSRIRLSLASIAQGVGLANGLHGLYQMASPIIAAHFGIVLP